MKSYEITGIKFNLTRSHRRRLAVTNCDKPPSLPGTLEGSKALAMVGAGIIGYVAHDLTLRLP